MAADATNTSIGRRRARQCRLRPPRSSVVARSLLVRRVIGLTVDFMRRYRTRRLVFGSTSGARRLHASTGLYHFSALFRCVRRWRRW